MDRLNIAKNVFARYCFQRFAIAVPQAGQSVNIIMHMETTFYNDPGSATAGDH